MTAPPHQAGPVAARPRQRTAPAAKRGPAKGGARRRRSLPTLLTASLIGLIVFYAVVLTVLTPPSPGQQLTLDTVRRDATCAIPVNPSQPDPNRGAYCSSAREKIETAEFLDEDARIVGTTTSLRGGQRLDFWAPYPKSDAETSDLLRILFSTDAATTVNPQTPKAVLHFLAQFILPLVLLANLFALLFALIQGRGGGASDFLTFGKLSNKRVAGAAKARTTFADVAGAGEAITELAEVRDYLADPSSFAAMGALPPKGVLLVGPPGCGKTLLAKAVAGEADASFYAMSGAEFVESLVGIGAARVRDLFAQARASAPSIIFIDELDAVGRQRGAGFGQGHDEREQTLNELLVQMDGFSPALGIVAIAATNRPDILDPALLRAGRFERHVTVEKPDVDGRLAILRLHATGRRLTDPEQDLAHIAHNTPGFSGADLANVINESALLAVRERAKSISLAHLQEAAERVLAGPKRKGLILTADERRCIAVHEGGHAVVAAAMGMTTNLQKLSIIARGRGVGHLAMLQEDRTVYHRDEMVAQIAIAMAGFAAEEIVFGEPSTGSEQDLERATSSARDMAGRFGMSDRLGPVRILKESKEIFLGRDYIGTRDVSQPTLEHLDAEVRHIVENQRDHARKILNANRKALDAISAALVEHETLQAPALRELLGRVKPSPPPPPPPAPVAADGNSSGVTVR